MTTGIDSVLAPYKGGSAALADLLGGHVQAMFDGLSTQLATIKAGKVRALAVTSSDKHAHLFCQQTVARRCVGGRPDLDPRRTQG